MIETLTAGAVLLAWFVFRYDRHQRWRESVDAGVGTLRAVHHGMVQGLTAGQAVGWGQIYFSRDYTQRIALDRAEETRGKVMNRLVDQVLVVPAEPLAKLATSRPQAGLIEVTTVAVANFALWRVHVFNQLVQQLTDFNTLHAVEIASSRTRRKRREELASAAKRLSLLIHLDGIGEAWSAQPGGGRGWYGALVEAVNKNIIDLEADRQAHRWRWLHDWPYPVVDLLVVAGFSSVVISVAS